MAKRTYRGSCACDRVRFEVELDLSDGTLKCNCTSCWKRRWWTSKARPEDFRVLAGESELVGVGERAEPSGFCKHCGVRPYDRIEATEWNDGAYVSVNVACLDDLEPADLIAAPVKYLNGRADDWWSPPSETGHL